MLLRASLCAFVCNPHTHRHTHTHTHVFYNRLLRTATTSGAAIPFCIHAYILPPIRLPLCVAPLRNAMQSVDLSENMLTVLPDSFTECSLLQVPPARPARVLSEYVSKGPDVPPFVPRPNAEGSAPAGSAGATAPGRRCRARAANKRAYDRPCPPIDPLPDRLDEAAEPPK